ncbi:MAG: 3-methyladenine DNA glycosylase [Gammaproteobacteria bacterium]|nr:3-methyladenine DNA glycosylase [Gammaproteobacteria bacterium]|tara:strand:- start:95 stop:772 length:678 start_codon:yes stop_codon:yes gene_type:complete
MKFADIRARAAKRKGAEALKKLLPKTSSTKQLIDMGNDRYLAAMAKVINQAGFSWKVVEKKWPEFEEAFFAFEPAKLGLLSPEQWEAYCSDKRVVRNWQKIKAVRENVFFVQEVSKEHGSFGEFVADWPVTNQIGLMEYLKKYGCRLGGNSGMYFLRRVGKDCFVLSKDVVLTLKRSGLDIADRPSTKRDLRQIQNQFNSWHEETKLPFGHLSRIAACSIGENYL